MSPRPRRRARLGALAAIVTAAGGLVVTSTSAPVAAAPADTHRSLVSLRDAGTGAAHDAGVLGDLVARAHLLGEQADVLARVGSPTPVYRWTTALNGFAVDLTAGQASVVGTAPDVASVERDEVRPLAAVPSSRGRAAGLTSPGPRRGGAGEVIGFVDTGIAPESPLFAQVRGGTHTPSRLVCDDGDDWAASDCNGKIVAAHWYVDGFGADHLTSASSLSPRDTDGHGTEMASIAAGNADVPVRIAGEPLGRYGGQAPQAQIAVYKACWSAPDPSDDGCSTADLVSAIDRATADRVDVLNLSVGGPDRIDTVERALLGAVEAGTVVTAAAGNDAKRSFAAHPSPWVTTVGSLNGAKPRGRVAFRHGPAFTGAMLSRRGIGGHRVVLAAHVPAADATRAQARVCTPGSLDAKRVEHAVVVCERGVVGRVDKSQAVALADGVGMVLVNVGSGSTDADAQQVPTVHLARHAGRHLMHYVARHAHARLRLEALPAAPTPARVTSWSSPGDARGQVLKPDVVAPGTGVLGAVPGTTDDGWDFVAGSSAATAYASGLAATLLSRPGWTPSRVRSALATTAAPVGRTSLLRSGAGRLRRTSAARPGLAYLVRPGTYRDWLDGRRAGLNTASVLLDAGTTRATRTVTNVSRHRLYFSSSARGFRSVVTVRPAALRLAPGESARITIRVPDGLHGRRVDDGYVVWRGATGTVTRLPVVIAR